MNILDTKISEVKIIEPRVYGDERGFFMNHFKLLDMQHYLAYEILLFRIIYRGRVEGFCEAYITNISILRENWFLFWLEKSLMWLLMSGWAHPLLDCGWG